MCPPGGGVPPGGGERCLAHGTRRGVCVVCLCVCLFVCLLGVVQIFVGVIQIFMDYRRCDPVLVVCWLCVGCVVCVLGHQVINCSPPPEP